MAKKKNELEAKFDNASSGIIEDIKNLIDQSRYHLSQEINSSLTILYWQENQKRHARRQKSRIRNFSH